jgi:hypothetical protein
MREFSQQLVNTPEEDRKTHRNRFLQITEARAPPWVALVA